jgi:predicted transposase YdaD
MEESVVYQEILREGLAKGKAEGLAKGKAEGLAKGKAEGLAKGKADGKVEATNQIAINMLRSNMSPDLVAQLTGLTLKQIQKLQKISIKKPRTKKSL